MRSTLYTAFYEAWFGLQRASVIPVDRDFNDYNDDGMLFPLKIQPSKRRELEQLAERATNGDMRRMEGQAAVVSSYAALLLCAEALSTANDVSEAAYYSSRIQEHRLDLGLLRAYEAISPAAWLDGGAKDAFWAQIQRERRARRGRVGRLPAGPALDWERTELINSMNPNTSQLQRQAAANKLLAAKYNVEAGTVRTAISRWRQRDTTG